MWFRLIWWFWIRIEKLLMLLNSESKLPPLQNQGQAWFFLVSQNFILVQKKWDTKSKGWDVGEVEDIINVDIVLNFDILIKFYIFLKFDILIKFDFFAIFDTFLKLNFQIWYFEQKQLIFWSNTLSCRIDILINNWYKYQKPSLSVPVKCNFLSGQKWFLRWLFQGLGGYFLLQSVFVFSFRWSEVPFSRYSDSYVNT